MEDFLHGVNNKDVELLENLGVTSSNISKNNQSLHPDQFYKKIQNPFLNHESSRILPKDFTNRSQVLSQSRIQDQQTFQHPRLINESQSFNYNQSKRINNVQHSSALQQNSESSDINDGSRSYHTVHDFNNRVDNNVNPCVMDNHVFRRPYDVIDHSKSRSGLLGRFDQLQDASQMRIPNVQVNNMSIASYFSSTSTCTIESIMDKMQTNISMLNLVYSEIGAPIEELEIEVQKFELKAKKKVIKRLCNSGSSNSSMAAGNMSTEKKQYIDRWLNSNNGVHEEINRIGTHQQQPHLLTTNMSFFNEPQQRTVTNETRPYPQQSINLNRMQQQYIQQPQQDLEGVHEEINRIGTHQQQPHLLTTNMSFFNEPQQRTVTNETRPYPQQSINLNRMQQQYIQQPQDLEDNQPVVSSTTRPESEDSQEAVGSDLLICNVSLRKRGRNTSKQRDFKEPLPVHNNKPPSKQKRSLSVPPLKTNHLLEKITTKALNKSNTIVGSSKQTSKEENSLCASPPKLRQLRGKRAPRELNNSNVNVGSSKPTSNSSKTTKKNNKSTSVKNQNNKGTKKKVALREENISLNALKMVEKVPAQESEKPVASKQRKQKVVKDELMKQPLGYDSPECLRTTRSTTVSARGRVIIPTLKYWEVNREPDRSNKMIDIQKKQKECSSKSKSSELNVTLRGKEEPVKRKRSLSSSPYKSKQGKTTKVLNVNNANVRIPKLTTEKNNEHSSLNGNLDKGALKKLGRRKKNNKENLPNYEPKKVKKVSAKKAEKPAASKGRKRKSVAEEHVAPKKNKQLCQNPDDSSEGCSFDELFDIFGNSGPSNNFRFEVPSPGEALKSIKKNNPVDCSGRETPPIRYLTSFSFNRSGQTKTPADMGEDEHKIPVRNFPAERIVKKIQKDKGNKKPVIKKNKKAVTKKTDPAMKKMLNQVLHSKGKIPKEVEQAFGIKKIYTDDDSFTSLDDDSNSDDFADLF